MKQLIQRISQTFWRIENKIAFYPSLMAICGIFFALMMVYLEQQGVSAYLQKAVPWLVINDLETARTLLSTLIAGLISILVFSFSMVMIILNQAASNFSPRLLPGLISNKKHQSILGIHLAGIFYCTITLITIEPTKSSYQLPGFSVLLAILFVTVSLGSFIYFIHSISQSIQVDYILKTTFNNAKKRIGHLIQLEQDNEIADAGLGRFDKSKDWNDYYAPQAGYIQTINTTRLLNLAQKHRTHIQVIPTKNTFLLAGLPIFKSETELDEDVAKEFLNQFLIDNSESLSENYSLAFKLITEIAIKAMSPGINDPGTALTCIDYLTELLTLRLKKSDQLYLVQDKQVVIEINIIHFEKLLYVILAPFRAYCSHDIIIVSKLLRMCEYLLLQECINDDYKKTIKKQANEIINDAREKLQNALDLAVLDDRMNKFESA